MDRKNKKYWIDKEVFSGIPGGDIYDSLRQCFQDYYLSDKKHEVQLKLNDVTVTFKRERF